MTLTFIDLFCGGGGTSIGFKQAGLKHIIGIDKDKRMKTPYTENVGEFLCSDVLAFDGTQKADVITLSPPCQPYSPLRHGERYEHDKEKADAGKYIFEKVIARLPQAIFIENVRGYQTSEAWTHGQKLLKDNGYIIGEKIINAADFGVPQTRIRFCAIAFHHSTNIRTLLATETFTLPSPILLHQPCGVALQRSKALYPYSPTQLPSPSQQALIDNPPPVTVKQFYRNVWKRIDPNKPSPTLTTYFARLNKSQGIHPYRDTPYTIHDGLILQGFPMDYILPMRTSGDKQVINKKLAQTIIGNAVPPPVAKYYAEYIKEIIQ